jgi:hypothetical protein
MSPPHGRAARVAYWLLLGLLALWVLAIFVRPSANRFGINQNERARFVALVEGSAHRPYVRRVLLPAATRMIGALVPLDARERLTATVQAHRYLRRGFVHLHWEPEVAHLYCVAAVLMWASFIAFGHAAGRLVVRTTAWPDELRYEAFFASLALLGVPAFFRFASYPYDPPQLALFAFALLFLHGGRLVAFGVTFALCCLNKETALLLIPLAAFVWRDLGHLRRRTILLGWLVGSFVAIEFLLWRAFRENLGSAVEVHFFDHNLVWLSRAWNWPELLSACGLAALLVFRWRDKPRFARTALVGLLTPLVFLALLFGFVNEWRDYYEAYPAALILAADTLWRWRGGPGAIDRGDAGV